ncbi:adenosine receptor A2a-like [Oculina patagonica]
MKNSTVELKGTADEVKIISLSFKAIAIIAAIFGNSMVFRAFHKFPSLRTASNCILVSLSVADSLTVIPFILHIASIALRIGDSIDNLSNQLLCESSARFSLVLISVIILHLALISVERAIAVKFALRYLTIVTNRRAVIACLVAWLWGVAVTLLFPLGLRADSERSYERLYQSLHPCFSYQEEKLSPIPSSTNVYYLFLLISLLAIPILIILYSYGYVFAVSYKHRRQIREQGNIQGNPTMFMKDELKGAYTLAIVVGVSFLSICPLWVVSRYYFFGVPFIIRKPWLRYSVYDFALGMNACFNPLVYGWRHEKFRKAFRKLLKCG